MLTNNQDLNVNMSQGNKDDLENHCNISDIRQC